MAGLKFNDMAPTRMCPLQSLMESTSLQAGCPAANRLYGLCSKSAARKAITSSGVVALAFANLSGHNGGSIKATASHSLIHRIDNSEVSQT
jgi:hypothetical protein